MRYFCLFLLARSFLLGMVNVNGALEQGYCLVFVHIGEEFPPHLSYSLAQARLFNPECSIFLIGYFSAFNEFGDNNSNVIPVPIEFLKKNDHHQKWIKNRREIMNHSYSVERFLYLDDFIQQYGLRNVFHIENDVMVYFSLLEKLPVFQKCYSNMVATTFDCDTRAVPSFVYVSNPETSSLLSDFIATKGRPDFSDMELLNLFKNAFYKKRSDHLPTLIPAYAHDYPLTNVLNKTARSAEPYSNHLDQLGMIFDAIALGQFLGGINPLLGESKPGFLGELSIFLPSFFELWWEKDQQGRFIPYISYRGETYPIANLHIHSKALELFSSINQNPPPIPTQVYSSLPFDHIQPKKVN